MRRVCAHARAGEALCTPRRCALVIVRMRGGQGFFSRGGGMCVAAQALLLSWAFHEMVMMMTRETLTVIKKPPIPKVAPYVWQNTGEEGITLKSNDLSIHFVHWHHIHLSRFSSFASSISISISFATEVG